MQSSFSFSLLLDLRAANKYKQHRIVPSTNIPYHLLEKNTYQLPAQNVAFAVLLPCEKELQEPITHNSLMTALKNYNVPSEWRFVDSEQFWSDAKSANKEIEYNFDESTSKKYLLFSPSPCVQKHFPTIHQTLSQKQDAVSESITATTTTTSNGASSSSTTLSAPRFHMLDVGCGAGRDMCWSLLQSNEWQVTGIDFSAHVLERAWDLAESLNVETRMNLYKAKINRSNGNWKLWKEATKPKPAETLVPAADVGSTTTKTEAPAAAANEKKQKQQKKRKRKEKEDEEEDEQTSSNSSTVNSSSPDLIPFLNRQYDLIVIVRFLSRTFFHHQLLSLLKPGGYFLLSTFINDGVTVYEQPSNPEFRIQSKEELVNIFEKELGMQIICNEIIKCEDGRPISDFLARKAL